MSANDENTQFCLKFREIINSLPEDVCRDMQVKDRFGALFSEISMKKVPVNSLMRIWILGSMQAKLAAGYLSYAVRGSFLSTSEKQELLNETNLNAALQLLSTMGYLRGVIVKVGQMLSNMPHTIPDEIAGIVGTLSFEAPPMHYSMIREVFLDEFGKEPEEVFASFEKKAFAAASFGQVHKARLKSGEQVAVKIQYPNMGRTIRSDLRSLRALLKPMSLMSELKYIINHIKDAESMFITETDYKQEAAFMKTAAGLFTSEDRIVIPRAWDQYTTKRVLTMDYLPGCHLEDFLSREPSQEARDHFGTLISTAFIRVWYRSKILYTDFNPGNFLFMDDGKIGMIDFGSQRYLSREEAQFNDRFEMAFLDNDIDALNKQFSEICLYDNVEDMDADKLEFLHRSTSWQTLPLIKDGTFDFGDRDFYIQGININAEALKKKYLRYNSLYNWWGRFVNGHRTLLYRLQSRVNYRDIYLKEKTY